jgi:hypothetical protein
MAFQVVTAFRISAEWRVRRVVVCDQSVLWFFVGSITKMKISLNSTNFVEKYNVEIKMNQ